MNRKISVGSIRCSLRTTLSSQWQQPRYHTTQQCHNTSPLYRYYTQHSLSISLTVGHATPQWEDSARRSMAPTLINTRSSGRHATPSLDLQQTRGSQHLDILVVFCPQERNTTAPHAQTSRLRRFATSAGFKWSNSSSSRMISCLFDNKRIFNTKSNTREGEIDTTHAPNSHSRT